MSQIYELQGKYQKALEFINELVSEEGLYPRVSKAVIMLHMNDENTHMQIPQTMADIIVEYVYLNSWLIYELLYIKCDPQKAIEQATRYIYKCNFSLYKRSS